MTLDPAAAGLLAMMAEAGHPPMEEGTPEDARLGFSLMQEMGGPGGAVVCLVRGGQPGDSERLGGDVRGQGRL